MRKFKHLLIDYDNTLAKSEQPAFRACCSLVNEVLSSYGVKVFFTPASLQEKFVGKSFRQMILDLSTEHKFNVCATVLETLVREEEDRVIAQLDRELEECDGVANALLWAQSRYTLSIVSSSASRRLLTCVSKTRQEAFFGERIFSASSSLPTPKSKPLSDIYHFTLSALNATPAESLAIEDSVSGLLAALGAGLPAIGYVGAYESDEEKTVMAEKLARMGAARIMHHWDHFPSIVADLESAA